MILIYRALLIARGLEDIPRQGKFVCIFDSSLCKIEKGLKKQELGRVIAAIYVCLIHFSAPSEADFRTEGARLFPGTAHTTIWLSFPRKKPLTPFAAPPLTTKQPL